MALAPNPEEVRDRFAFHPANDVTGPLHGAVRQVFAETANKVLEFTPASREQSLALTALQEAMMWCNAAIACNQGVTE